MLSLNINTIKGRRIISNNFASDIVGIPSQILLSWTSALWTRLPACGMSMESLCWNLSSLPAAPLDNVLPGHLHAGFLSLLGGANRCRGRCRGREGAPPSQELPPSIQHITPPSLLFLPDRCVLARSEAPPWGRHRIHQDPINLVSGFSADILPSTNLYDLGAIFEEEIMKIEFDIKNVIKKNTWLKTTNRKLQNKNSHFLHFLINSKNMHYQGWVSKFSLRTFEKVNQWPDYWILDTFETCLLIGLSKIKHLKSWHSWQLTICIDIIMENIWLVA